MDDLGSCQWDSCPKAATVLLVSSDERQQVCLCQEHRRAALVNLELHNSFFAPKSARGQGLRPGAPPPMPQITPSARPGQIDSAQNWQKKAAQSADSAAKPVEDRKPVLTPKKISSIPTKRS